MLVEKIVGNADDMDLGQRKVDRVFMEWFELEKKHIRKSTESGLELGISLDKSLRDKDLLYIDEEKAIVVEQLPSKLTKIKVSTMKEMGSLCFELGNRHLSLAISDDSVSVIYDQPTYEYLVKLGFNAVIEEGIFSDYKVCHAHGHGHNHEH